MQEEEKQRKSHTEEQIIRKRQLSATEVRPTKRTLMNGGTSTSYNTKPYIKKQIIYCT